MQQQGKINPELKIWESPEAAREVAARVLLAASKAPTSLPALMSRATPQGTAATGGSEALQASDSRTVVVKPWWAQQQADGAAARPPEDLQRKVTDEPSSAQRSHLGRVERAPLFNDLCDASIGRRLFRPTEFDSDNFS
jgi:hypothetical protein